MTYETFVLLRKAVEAQCVATQEAINKASELHSKVEELERNRAAHAREAMHEKAVSAELRAQVAELTQQRDHAIAMHALRGKAMLLLENPEVSAELRAQVATLQAACAVKDAALLATRIYVEAEVYTHHDKASEKVALIDAALSSSPGAPLLAAVEGAAKALDRCIGQLMDFRDHELDCKCVSCGARNTLAALAPYRTNDTITNENASHKCENEATPGDQQKSAGPVQG